MTSVLNCFLGKRFMLDPEFVDLVVAEDPEFQDGRNRTGMGMYPKLETSPISTTTMESRDSLDSGVFG